MANANICEAKDCNNVFDEKDGVGVLMKDGHFKHDLKSIELCPQCASQFEAVFERMTPESDD